MAKHCAVLFVDPGPDLSAHPAPLRETGFIVHEAREWPREDAALREYHVIIVRVRAIDGAPMLAARFRARPHMDRRLLVALVDAAVPAQARRAAQAAGFDDVVNEGCDTRQLVARVLRRLRLRPELRCTLPAPPRRTAA